MTLAADAIEVRYDTRRPCSRRRSRSQPGELVALVGPERRRQEHACSARSPASSRTAGPSTWRGTPLARLDRRDARAHRRVPAAESARALAAAAREVVALGRLPHRAYGAEPSAADDAAVTRRDAPNRHARVRGAQRASGCRSANAHACCWRARSPCEAPVLLVDEPIAMLDPYHQLRRHARAARLRHAADGDERAAARGRRAARPRARRTILRPRAADERAATIVGDGPPEATLGAAAIRDALSRRAVDLGPRRRAGDRALAASRRRPPATPNATVRQLDSRPAVSTPPRLAVVELEHRHRRARDSSRETQARAGRRRAQIDFDGRDDRGPSRR